jgi:hypothetical protein
MERGFARKSSIYLDDGTKIGAIASFCDKEVSDWIEQWCGRKLLIGDHIKDSTFVAAFRQRFVETEALVHNPRAGPTRLERYS